MTEEWKSHFAKIRSGKRPKQQSGLNMHKGYKNPTMSHPNCGTKIKTHAAVKRNDTYDNKKSQMAPITNKHFQRSLPTSMHVLLT